MKFFHKNIRRRNFYTFVNFEIEVKTGVETTISQYIKNFIFSKVGHCLNFPEVEKKGAPQKSETHVSGDV